MKIKIITTSSSTIDYMSSPYSISVIPDIISYSKNEEYLDYLEAESEIFYNRLKMDLTGKPKIEPNRIEYIRKIVDASIENEYEQILFILPSANIVDYKALVELAMKDYEISYYVYQSIHIGYPLAHLTLEADRMLKENMDIYNVIKKIDEISLNIKLFIYSPEKDLLSAIKRVELDDDILSYDDSGKIYSYNMGSLNEIKVDKNNYPLAKILTIYLKELDKQSSMPFILYSSKLSKYINFIEDT
ncbi:MAG: DegV family protein, partial [Acholeplasmatales bacterium]|nr:DegV family protein [Acholeplasmatales bacterium]